MTSPAFLAAGRVAAHRFAPVLRRARTSALSPQLNRHQPTRTVATAVLRPKVAIVGGGHGGLATALRLATMPWTRLTRPTITLIDQSDRFVFLPMIYELALGQVAQWEIAPRFSDLLADTPVRFEHARLEDIDLEGGTLHTRRIDRATSNVADDLAVEFDRVVMALGAAPAYIETVPGATEFAQPFYTMMHAIELKSRLAELRSARAPGSVINVIVVGAGFSGVELASCLAEDLGSEGSVMVVETSDMALRAATPFNRRTALDALTANGAVVEYKSRVSEVRADGVTLLRDPSVEGADPTAIDYAADLVLWTAGSKANPALSGFGLPLDNLGRMQTDQYQQIVGLEDRAYALGDAASPLIGSNYLGTAQVANQQAEYAAWNVWASLTERPKLESKYTHLGEMMVLGSQNACVSTTVGLELDGQPAWAARRIAYLARLPTEQHRARVAASWAISPVLQGLSDVVEASRAYNVPKNV